MSIWTYNKKPIETPPDEMFGFVYCITNTNSGRKYIGKKQFISHRTKKVAGKRNRKHTIKESDWKTYYGSCEELLADMALLGEEVFTREIIRMCPTKRDLTFGEIELQIKNDVLTAKQADGTPAYYNRNIMSRWFVVSDKPKKKTTKGL
jgi:Kyanoviridae NAD synthetase